MLEQSYFKHSYFLPTPDCLGVRVFKQPWVPIKCYSLPLTYLFWLHLNKFPVHCGAKIVCLREFCKRALGYLFCREHSPASLFYLKSVRLSSTQAISFSGKIFFIIEIVLWFTTYGEITVVVFLEKRQIEHVLILLNTLSLKSPDAHQQ